MENLELQVEAKDIDMSKVEDTLLQEKKVYMMKETFMLNLLLKVGNLEIK